MRKHPPIRAITSPFTGSRGSEVTGGRAWQGVVVNVRFVCERALAMGIDGHVCELQLFLRDCPFESVSTT